MDAEEIRANLKNIIVEDIELAFDKIPIYLKGSETTYNQFLAIKGRYFDLKKDTREGILEYAQQIVSQNNIRSSLLEFISSLRARDLHYFEQKGINFKKPLSLNTQKAKEFIELQKKEAECLKNWLGLIEELNTIYDARLLLIKAGIMAIERLNKEFGENYQESKRLNNVYDEILSDFFSFHESKILEKENAIIYAAKKWINIDYMIVGIGRAYNFYTVESHSQNHCFMEHLLRSSKGIYSMFGEIIDVVDSKESRLPLFSSKTRIWLTSELKFWESLHEAILCREELLPPKEGPRS